MRIVLVVGLEPLSCNGLFSCFINSCQMEKHYNISQAVHRLVSRVFASTQGGQATDHHYGGFSTTSNVVGRPRLRMNLYKHAGRSKGLLVLSMGHSLSHQQEGQ